MTNKKIGSVTHYYDKIGVAIIELTDSLSAGEKILFTRGGEELFEQVVNSMQIEHNEITNAHAQDVIGLKTDKEVKEGAEVFKVD